MRTAASPRVQWHTADQQTRAEAAAVSGDPSITAERLEAEGTTPIDEADARPEPQGRVDAHGIEAVLSIGGVLGIGDRLIALPLDDIELGPAAEGRNDEVRIEIAMSTSEIAEHPDFRYEAKD